MSVRSAVVAGIAGMALAAGAAPAYAAAPSAVVVAGDVVQSAGRAAPVTDTISAYWPCHWWPNLAPCRWVR